MRKGISSSDFPFLRSREGGTDGRESRLEEERRKEPGRGEARRRHAIERETERVGNRQVDTDFPPDIQKSYHGITGTKNRKKRARSWRSKKKRKGPQLDNSVKLTC